MKPSNFQRLDELGVAIATFEAQCRGRFQVAAEVPLPAPEGARLQWGDLDGWKLLVASPFDAAPRSLLRQPPDVQVSAAGELDALLKALVAAEDDAERSVVEATHAFYAAARKIATP